MAKIFYEELGMGNQVPAAITLTRPDDWHLHLRDLAMLAAVLPHTARRFARAIIMSNLKPPITTVQLARMYRKRIMNALPVGMSFKPLMTLYLTDNTSPKEISKAKDSNIIHGVKLYPAGATTNSALGVSNLQKCTETIAQMEKLGIPLLVHGEVTNPSVDIFDREAVFIDTVLTPLLRDFSGLRVVLEHVTTKDGIDFVLSQGENIAATLTAHHLLLNRNALFAGGLQPHHYCLPILKREKHRQALLAAAISGNPKFFLGTDSAPHAQDDKESACGCAGCYTAHAAIELYAEAFGAAGALSRLEGFASHFGADWYGLPRNKGEITLIRKDRFVPKEFVFGEGKKLIPLRAGEVIPWQLAEN